MPSPGATGSGYISNVEEGNEVCSRKGDMVTSYWRRLGRHESSAQSRAWTTRAHGAFLAETRSAGGKARKTWRRAFQGDIFEGPFATEQIVIIIVVVIVMIMRSIRYGKEVYRRQVP